MANRERVLLRPIDATPLSELVMAKVMEKATVMEKLMVESGPEENGTLRAMVVSRRRVWRARTTNKQQR